MRAERVNAGCLERSGASLRSLLAAGSGTHRKAIERLVPLHDALEIHFVIAAGEARHGCLHIHEFASKCYGHVDYVFASLRFAIS
jgi:hypothetical protein